mmetsp:Transcript_11009/g.13291  ORF Transcript_11009/g.13291 Transcript_11009/m.13291 type:complete len:1192 (+) Transcript_11009:120-3695(+)
MVSEAGIVVGAIVALYVVPILELIYPDPNIMTLLMLFAALCIFPFMEIFFGCMKSAPRFSISGIALLETLRIYFQIQSNILTSVLVVVLTGYISESISVWILSKLTHASRKSRFHNFWASLLCCSSRSLRNSDHSVAGGCIGLYLSSTINILGFGVIMVISVMFISFGLFRSPLLISLHNSSSMASLHGALHTVDTLCDNVMDGVIDSDVFLDAIKTIRVKLFDHENLSITKITCVAGEWEFKGMDNWDVASHHHKYEVKETTAWVSGIPSESIESYSFQLVSALACLVSFLLCLMFGSQVIQKAFGRATKDTLDHLSSYDNTTQLFNKSAPPFYSMLHDDHTHSHESWGTIMTLWRNHSMLFRPTPKSCFGKKKKKEGKLVMHVESLDLEAAADHLIHLYQMKRDHHDVRRNGNIDRGQFVDPVVSDWISSVFKHSSPSVSTSAPPTAVQSNKEPPHTLPPLKGSIAEHYPRAEVYHVDTTKLDILVQRMKSKEITDAKKAEQRRRRKRNRGARTDENVPFVVSRVVSNEDGFGSFYSPGLGGGGGEGSILAARTRRVYSAPASTTSMAGPHEVLRRLTNPGLVAKRNKLVGALDTVATDSVSGNDPPPTKLKIGPSSLIHTMSEVDRAKFRHLTLSSANSEVIEGGSISLGSFTPEHQLPHFENWEDTFGGERIGKSHIPVDMSTRYHIQLDSIKLDVLQFDMHELKELVTEVLKTTAPLPAPLPAAHSAPAKRTLGRKTKGPRLSSFKRRVAAIVCEESLSPATIAAFVSRVIDGYDKRPQYHNAYHGADVCHTIWRFQRICGGHFLFTPVEMFAQLVAALGHDLGHPGLNNNYLVSNYHPLAMSYHDESPLENMHCHELFKIINTPGGDCDVFRGLGVRARAESREIVVKCILSTDMAFHAIQVTKLTELVNKVVNPSYVAALADLPNCSRFGPTPHPALNWLEDVETRRGVLEVLVHTADINNPLKPRDLAIPWTTRVVAEFCAQGDRERSENSPISPMCDRNKIDLTSMQLGFMDFVVAPLLTKVIALFPSLVEHSFYLYGNYSRFAKLKESDLYKASSEAEVNLSAVSTLHRQPSDALKIVPMKPVLPPAVEALRSRRNNLALGFFTAAYPQVPVYSNVKPLHTIVPRSVHHSLKRSESWSPSSTGHLGEVDQGDSASFDSPQQRGKFATRVYKMLNAIRLGRP